MAGARRNLRSNSHKTSQQDKHVVQDVQRSKPTNTKKSKGQKSVAGGKRAKRVSNENGVVEDLEQLDAAVGDGGNTGTFSLTCMSLC